MSASSLIIDGYNLLHASGLSQARYAPGDLHRQRQRLLKRLATALTAEERVRCTVAFDAIEAPTGLERQFRHAEISILFAEPGHDADTLIEALIDAHSAPTQLIVVSSDHRLQRAARHRHAESVDSEVFLQCLATRGKSESEAQANSPPARGKTTSPADDLTYWLGEFGDIDVDALAISDDLDAHPLNDPWHRDLDALQKRLDQPSNLDDWLNQPPGTPPD